MKIGGTIMKLDKYHLILLAVIVVLIVITIKSCQSKKDNEKEQIALISSLQDTVHFFKNKDSNNVARIEAIKTESSKTFLNLKSSDSEIIRLQSVVKDYKSKLSAGSSVTNIGGNTKIDTTITHNSTGTDTIRKDSLVYIYPIYLDTIRNKWISYTSRIARDSSKIAITFTDSLSVIIGIDKKKPFVDIINYNPYSTTKTLRTYQVSLPPPKRFGLGFVVAYGIGDNLKLGVFAGVGLTYNLIRF